MKVIILFIVVVLSSCGDAQTKSSDGSNNNGVVIIANNGTSPSTNNQTSNNQGSNNQTTMTTPVVIPEGCGDSTLATDEECEGFELRGNQCTSLGFEGGVLKCSSACQFDTSECFKCGDGVIQNEESCDGADFGDLTCASVLDDEAATGELGCSSRCRVQSDECVVPASCVESSICRSDCGADEECQERCPPPASDQETAYNTLWNCLERNNCFNLECAEQFCPQEVRSCFNES